MFTKHFVVFEVKLEKGRVKKIQKKVWNFPHILCLLGSKLWSGLHRIKTMFPEQWHAEISVRFFINIIFKLFYEHYF